MSAGDNFKNVVLGNVQSGEKNVGEELVAEAVAIDAELDIVHSGDHNCIALIEGIGVAGTKNLALSDSVKNCGIPE